MHIPDFLVLGVIGIEEMFSIKGQKSNLDLLDVLPAKIAYKVTKQT